MDRGRYHEVKKILEAIISQNPSEDAQVNLSRVSEIISTQEKSEEMKNAEENKTFNASDFVDPIEAAFAVEKSLNVEQQLAMKHQRLLTSLISIRTSI